MSSRISGNGHCLVILTCMAESRGGTVTYSWTPLGPRTVVSHGGSVLSVSLRPGDGALNFTCMVKNPVSNSSSLPVLVPPSCTGTRKMSTHPARQPWPGWKAEEGSSPLQASRRWANTLERVGGPGVGLCGQGRRRKPTGADGEARGSGKEGLDGTCNCPRWAGRHWC